MKLLEALLFTAVLSIGATAVAGAAAPVIGTWNLNLAKSTFSPGPAPQSQTRTYAESDAGIALTVTTTGADGKQSTTTLTFKEDGKPYPATGTPEFDAVKVKRINARTASSVQLKGGVKVGTGLRRVSKDGKTLTFKQKGTDASGAKYDNVAVYDRQ
jgi:hypothetical protein